MAESGEGKDPFFTLEKLKIASGLVDLQKVVVQLMERLNALERNIDLNRHDAKYVADRTNDVHALLSDLSKTFTEKITEFDLALRGDEIGKVKGVLKRLDDLEGKDRIRMWISGVAGAAIITSIIGIIFGFFGKAIEHGLRYWVYGKAIHHH